MNKILVLIVMLFVLTSCFDKTQEILLNDDTGTVVEGTTNDNLNTDDTIPVVVDDNEGIDTTSIKVVDNNTTGDETNTDTDTITEINSADEEILEDEVNALLDEFIDSLDNYDK